MELLKVLLESKVCLTCNRTFYRTYHRPKHWKNVKFCSKKCTGKYKTGKLSPLYKKGKYTKTEKICPTCNNTFISEYNYCSKTCSNRFETKDITSEEKRSKRLKVLKKQQERYEKNKLELVRYKGDKCAICGYNKCIAALDFHHLNPSNKNFNIGQNRGKSIEILKSEVDKCIMICANCHKELHYNEVRK